VRRQRNIELVNKKSRAVKLLSDPKIVNFEIYAPRLVSIERKRTNVTLNKPIFLATTVLEISKLVIYEFYYDVLLPKFGENVKLVYQDTDSFVLEISCLDLYKELETISQHLDTSNYPPDHALHSPVGRGEAWLMKDECPPPNIITEFCSLKPKSYAYSTLHGKTVKRGKGVPASALKATDISQYKKALFQKRIYKTSFKRISSKKHIVSIHRQKKISLSPLDDKRYWLSPFGLSSLPFGHRRIAPKRSKSPS
jgi:hypothetical protein